MALNGVDISGYDEGIDTTGLTADFVIVKATEGTQGTIYNRSYRNMATEALNSGKLLGFYHYANGEDPIAEADSFYSAIKDYNGKAIPCLDWEGQGNDLFGSGEDVDWCRTFLDRIAHLTGATPMLYIAKTVCNQWDWSSCVQYPLWGAEYAYDDYTYQGYEDDPWQSNRGWGAWGNNVTIHQYGYVLPQPNDGGAGSLDADKFYGSREDWARLCGKRDEKPQQQSGNVLNDYGIRYQAHVQSAGWMAEVRDGQVAGSTGYAKRLEAIKINPPKGIELEVKVHLQKLGDKTYTVSNGNSIIIGTTGEARRMEAITIKCIKNETGLSVRYQGHVQSIGWTGICEEGQLCGTTGQAKRLEAVKIWLENIPKQVPGNPKNNNDFKYSGHVQKLGWCPTVRDGQTAGTEGYALRFEALKITPPSDMILDAYIHVQGIGNLYFDDIKNGNDTIIGTIGEARRAEAVKFRIKKWPENLKGKKLYYQGHVQKLGWTNVCTEGQWCGTRGEARRLEAVRIWIGD